MGYRLVISAWMIVAITTLSSAQDTTRTSPSISQGIYDSLVSQLDYTKTKKVLQWKESQRQQQDSQGLEPIDVSGLSQILRPIAYIAIICLIIGILYWLSLGMRGRDQQIDISEIDLHAIEDISEIDTRSGYDEAVANGDFRLALRLRFVQSLQLLSEREYIRWKPDKTNRNYVRELSQHRELQTDFRQLAQIYEWVWYGHTDIDEATFYRLDRDHQIFHKKMTDEE